MYYSHPSTSSNESFAPFYFDATLCHGTSCRSVGVQWVHDFDDISGDSELAVLSRAVGNALPGLYVRNVNTWQLAVTFDSLVKDVSTVVSKLTLILNKTDTTQAPTNTVRLFRNGQSLDLSTPLTPTKTDVWVLLEPVPEGYSVTKQVPAPKEGLLQVSAADDRSIKDYVPPAGPAVITVEADGTVKPWAYEAIYSGAGLKIGYVMIP